MVSGNSAFSLRSNSAMFVELAFDRADLALIASELDSSARYLESEIELNDGTMNQAWIDQTLIRINRLREIARAIVLASQ